MFDTLENNHNAHKLEGLQDILFFAGALVAPLVMLFACGEVALNIMAIAALLGSGWVARLIV
jgi:hypothetical protein